MLLLPICPNFMISDVVLCVFFTMFFTTFPRVLMLKSHGEPFTNSDPKSGSNGAKAHVPHPWQLWHRRLELSQGPTGPDGSEVLRVFAAEIWRPFSLW
jgi:hypothetical protein